MHTCARGPMIGRRMGWGDHFASDHRHAKLAERGQVATDIAGELTVEVIARNAIEPVVIELEPWSSITADEFGSLDAWLESWDDWDRDPYPDDCPLSMLAAVECGDIDAEDAGYVDISCATDRDGVPGWGTHLDFEDLAGLTITNRPYGFSGYGQRDR